MSDVKIPKDIREAAESIATEFFPPQRGDRRRLFVAVSNALLEQRERCAGIADEQADREPYGHAKHAAVTIAQAIRSPHE